jgi:leucyl-tRNA synthetase
MVVDRGLGAVTGVTGCGIQSRASIAENDPSVAVGFVQDKQKISKSIGNVIDPLQLVDQYGLDFTRSAHIHKGRWLGAPKRR